MYILNGRYKLSGTVGGLRFSELKAHKAAAAYYRWKYRQYRLQQELSIMEYLQMR